MLPRMDGYAVIKKLRSDRLGTQTILVSARDSMEDIIQGLDAGADDYLTKPFALDVLLVLEEGVMHRPEAGVAALWCQVRVYQLAVDAWAII